MCCHRTASTGKDGGLEATNTARLTRAVMQGLRTTSHSAALANCILFGIGKNVRHHRKGHTPLLSHHWCKTKRPAEDERQIERAAVDFQESQNIATELSCDLFLFGQMTWYYTDDCQQKEHLKFIDRSTDLHHFDDEVDDDRCWMPAYSRITSDKWMVRWFTERAAI